MSAPAAAADRGTAARYAEWAKAAVASPPPGPRFLAELERELIDLAKARRAEAAPGLKTDPGCELAAQAHALDMLERGYVDHVGPDGRDVADRVAILHRRFVGGTGENLAEHNGLEVERLAEQAGPLAVKIVDGWMASPGHRQNLMEPEYTHQGLAAAGQGDRVVIVQVFGRRQALLEQPLPLEVERGARLALDIETDGDAPAPQKFAFAPPGKAADELVTLD
ncbi:MAG TPA: CAP domain-containing protein, partial [Geminicoccaceae bacterium]|nr:CAP domain-containing protein [Geminicoccaceae bacterium]